MVYFPNAKLNGPTYQDNKLPSEPGKRTISDEKVNSMLRSQMMVFGIKNPFFRYEDNPDVLNEKLTHYNYIVLAGGDNTFLKTVSEMEDLVRVRKTLEDEGAQVNDPDGVMKINEAWKRVVKIARPRLIVNDQVMCIVQKCCFSVSFDLEPTFFVWLGTHFLFGLEPTFFVWVGRHFLFGLEPTFVWLGTNFCSTWNALFVRFGTHYIRLGTQFLFGLECIFCLAWNVLLFGLECTFCSVWNALYSAWNAILFGLECTFCSVWNAIFVWFGINFCSAWNALLFGLERNFCSVWNAIFVTFIWVGTHF